MEALSFRSGEFNRHEYANPALQKHYSNLEVLALEQEVEDECQDSLQPDDDLLLKRGREVRAGMSGRAGRRNTD